MTVYLMKDVTVAILAGGNSKRFGSMKALVELNGKPLVTYMLELAKRVSSEVLIAVSDDEQVDQLLPFSKNARVVVDPDDERRSALTGALTAFEYTETKYTLLLPVDSPFAKVAVLDLLIRLRDGHGAVVPSWPSGHIEPLHAVYHAEHAYANGLDLVEQNTYKMRDLLDRLHHVLYVSTEALKQFDPDLVTFKNFNTEKELKAFENHLKQKC